MAAIQSLCSSLLIEIRRKIEFEDAFFSVPSLDVKSIGARPLTFSNAMPTLFLHFFFIFFYREAARQTWQTCTNYPTAARL